MARRRFRGTRGAASKFARKRLAWSTGLFGVALDFDATPSDILELALFEPATDVLPATADFNRKWRVKRIIAKGNVVPIPQVATATIATLTVNTALYVIDRDDTDATIVGTATGEILEGGADRLLYVDCQSKAFIEGPTGDIGPGFVEGPRIDIDWSGTIVMGTDQIILLSFQVPTLSAVNVFSSMTVQCITRVLFEAT